MANSSLYDILGVESSASTSEIKKAFRKLALLHHPDKVSVEEREVSEAKFKEISNAYKILIDDDLRHNYDLYGTEDGSVPPYPGADFDFEFEQPQYGGHAFNGSSYEFGQDDFANFFNNMAGNGNGSKSKKTKTDNFTFEVEISLEDLYRGKVIKFNSTRNIICTTCKGTGARPKAKTQECEKCKGKGSQEKIKMTPFGFAARVREECKKCNGKGSIYRPKDKCKKCNGTFTIEQKKVLEFIIEKGSKSTDKIVLEKEADEYPGLIPGDIILSYTTKEHPIFKRSTSKDSSKSADLFTKVKIPLVDALTGFKEKKIVKHLDNRWISLGVPAGKVINPGDSILVPNEGMPIKSSGSFFGSNSSYGNLYIGIEVEFPKDNWFIEKNDVLKLRTLLDFNYSTTDGNSNSSNGFHANGYKVDNASSSQDDEQITSVQFSVVGKQNLSKEFGTYLFDIDFNPSKLNEEKEQSQQKSWFSWW